MDIVRLLEEVKKHIGGKRFSHIEGTCRCAEELAEIYLPSEREAVMIAACLHDITKHYSVSEHIAYAENRGIEVLSDYKSSPKTLHELTGAHRARELFPELVSDSVFTAIRYHTTGRADMSLIEKLIYLADYIEPTRTFPDCLRLRIYFGEGMVSAKEMSQRLLHLDKTLIMSFDMTIKDLVESGSQIHAETVMARNYLIENLKNA